MDDGGGKVTGKICHIEGRKKGSARYNPNQSYEERRTFENLVIMCPVHHDVIDDDDESYTVGRLKELKAAHESANVGGTEPSDAVVAQLIANISNTTIVDGSLIFTHNQMGGQVAHSITNVGPQPRQFTSAAANELVRFLKDLPPEKFLIKMTWGDTEASELGENIKSVLELAGWSCGGMLATMFNQPLRGMGIVVSEENAARNLLAYWFNTIGLNPFAQLNSDAGNVEIVIGSAP